MSFKRSISFNLGKRKFNLKIYQLFLLILIFSVAVTGTTYAYFMTSSFIKNKITGWVGNVTDFIKRLFGINSPSKVFKEQIGTNLALGIGEGFSETMRGVNKEMANAIPTEFDTEIHSNINGTGITQSNYDNIVYAFIQALRYVKVVMNNREMGAFVTDTVTREVFAQ